MSQFTGYSMVRSTEGGLKPAGSADLMEKADINFRCPCFLVAHFMKSHLLSSTFEQRRERKDGMVLAMILIENVLLL